MADFGLKEFLEFLYDGLDGYVCVPVIKPGQALRQAERKYFKVPEQLDAMRQCIEEADAKGCTVHHTPAVFDSNERAAKNTFKATNVLWAEFDGNAPENPDAQPTLKIQSSVPGKEHWYYKLAEPITDAAQLEAQNKRIADKYKADRCYNAGRLLRPLNTHHRKNPSNPLPVKLVFNDLSRKFSIKEIDTSRPKLPDSAVKVKPSELPKYSRELLESAKSGVVGDNRSEDIFAAVQAMYENGFVEEDAVAYLIELDDAYERWEEGVRPQRAQEEAERQWDKHCVKAAELAATTFSGLTQNLATSPVVQKALTDTESFWQARPELQHILQFSRSRFTPPWPVLGCVLARVTASIEPHIVLPAIVGKKASLNLFVGLVGGPGSGKSVSNGIAQDCIKWPVDIFKTSPGSGEGLTRAYKTVHKTKDGYETTRHNTRALFIAEEIDTLTALKSRQASTLMPELRKAYMGETLGFAYADTTKRVFLSDHEYRLCLTVGIQPDRAEELISESDGGTPQRFLWMPAIDPDAPEIDPDEPEPFVWKNPFEVTDNKVVLTESKPEGFLAASLQLGEEAKEQSHTAELVQITVSSKPRETIIQNRKNTRRTGVDMLDGHKLLTQLKVAAALAFLNGRTDVNDEDWDLAQIVMHVSDETRSSVIGSIQQVTAKKNQARAHNEAVRAVVIDEVKEDAAKKRVTKNILAKLTSEWSPHSDIRRKLKADIRSMFDDVVAELIELGQVEMKEDTYNNKPVVKYRLAQ